MKKVIFIITSVVLLSIIVILITLYYNHNNYSKKENVKDDPLQNEENERENMKAKITINNIDYDVTLFVNETTEKLITMLPLNITMNELNNNEKYYYFEDTFPTNKTNPTYINSGDIMLYGNNCLVLFYDSFQTNYEYTKIGKIDNYEQLNINLGTESIQIKLYL